MGIPGRMGTATTPDGMTTAAIHIKIEHLCTVTQIFRTPAGKCRIADGHRAALRTATASRPGCGSGSGPTPGP